MKTIAFLVSRMDHIIAGKHMRQFSLALAERGLPSQHLKQSARLLGVTQKTPHHLNTKLHSFQLSLHCIRKCYREDVHEPPQEGLSSVAGGIVALGKFDALHIGHRELSIQAAKFGVPFLLSFVGMAEVFGWEPRAPIVAKCDRKRVLSSWAPYCSDMIPVEYELEFSKVRHLTPRQFVEMLSKKLGVHGVVAGENYRFGYKAAGDSSDLARLSEEYGMGAYIINTVMDMNQDNGNTGSDNFKEHGQVSSTRVRRALAKGDIRYVSELLGRQHRLMLTVKDQEWFVSNQHKVSTRKSCFLNLPPKEGIYERCSLVMDNDSNAVPCKVTIDTNDIHLDMEESYNTCNSIVFQDFQWLGIDFGESGG